MQRGNVVCAWRRLRRPAALLAGLFAMVAGTSSVQAETPAAGRETLVMAADVWCPYNCGEQDAQPGYLVEIGKLVFARPGRDVVYKVVPWTRALADTRAGKIPMAIGAVGGDDSGNLLNRVSLGRDVTVLATHLDNPFRYDGVQSLRRVIVGVINEYSYDGDGPVDQYINAREPNSQVVVLHRENALELLIRMLEGKRIDGLLENPSVLAFNVRGTALEGKLRLQPVSTGDNIFFAFTPNANGKKLAEEFDHRLLQLDRAGEIERIMKRYGLPYEPLKLINRSGP